MTHDDCAFFNHHIFLTVFQGFLCINLQHIMATHDVSHVWKGVGGHRSSHFTMTRCKSKSLPYKNMNEYLHQKGCRNACTVIIAQQSILFTKDWTIQKSTFYGISVPASPNLEGHSTHVVWLRASPSVHSCTKELTLDRLQVSVNYLV